MQLQDRQHLRCTSPESLFGQMWETACAPAWYVPNGNQAEIGTTQKVWVFLMLSLIIFSISICIIMSIRRWFETKVMERQEEERERNMDEAREMW